jgi:hypothetical protein
MKPGLVLRYGSYSSACLRDQIQYAAEGRPSIECGRGTLDDFWLRSAKRHLLVAGSSAEDMRDYRRDRQQDECEQHR